MGNEQKKPKQQVKPLDKQQTIIELRMQAKRFGAQAAKAEQEKEAMMKKAKREMQKNNEEMAKMYLNQAAIKQN